MAIDVEVINGCLPLFVWFENQFVDRGAVEGEERERERVWQLHWYSSY